MCSGLHSATVTPFSTGTPLTTGTLASSLLRSHPDLSICHPAVRVTAAARATHMVVHPYEERDHNAFTRLTALPHVRNPELGQTSSSSPRPNHHATSPLLTSAGECASPHAAPTREPTTEPKAVEALPPSLHDVPRV
jgi:hypothetical protein